MSCRTAGIRALKLTTHTQSDREALGIDHRTHQLTTERRRPLSSVDNSDADDDDDDDSAGFVLWPDHCTAVPASDLARGSRRSEPSDVRADFDRDSATALTSSGEPLATNEAGVVERQRRLAANDGTTTGRRQAALELTVKVDDETRGLNV